MIKLQKMSYDIRRYQVYVIARIHTYPQKALHPIPFLASYAKKLRQIIRIGRAGLRLSARVLASRYTHIHTSR